MVVYPEGVWYTYVDKTDIDEIIDEHLARGRVVDRLRICPCLRPAPPSGSSSRAVQAGSKRSSTRRRARRLGLTRLGPGRGNGPSA